MKRQASRSDRAAIIKCWHGKSPVLKQRQREQKLQREIGSNLRFKNNSVTIIANFGGILRGYTLVRPDYPCKLQSHALVHPIIVQSCGHHGLYRISCYSIQTEYKSVTPCHTTPRNTVGDSRTYFPSLVPVRFPRRLHPLPYPNILVAIQVGSVGRRIMEWILRLWNSLSREAPTASRWSSIGGVSRPSVKSMKSMKSTPKLQSIKSTYACPGYNSQNRPRMQELRKSDHVMGHVQANRYTQQSRQLGTRYVQLVKVYHLSTLQTLDKTPSPNLHQSGRYFSYHSLAHMQFFFPSNFGS